VALKLAIPAVCLAVAGQLALSATASATTHTVRVAHKPAITSGPTNLLDCNVTALERLCTDPHGKSTSGGEYAGRFIDPKTGAYVGHDEPSVKFISSQRGSGNTMSYGMQLSRDPKAAPTPSGSVTDYGELSVAPWFGLPICDPKSYPQNPCKPLSDSNTGLNTPTDAGSAFMELQFYPPGFTPFNDAVSCSTSQWCAALNIDSLECSFNFATCNNNCIEPVNFSFLQTNGVPPGPPSPQGTNAATFLGNAQTLKMNPGDTLKVSITNVPDKGSPDIGGLKATVHDFTTGQTGWVVASAKNGFANTSMTDCSGRPHSFHAEYNTAKKKNQVPWAALEGGVLMEQEIGHGESCSSVTNQLPFSQFGYVDQNVFQTCNGGVDSSNNAAGEGPCTVTNNTVSCANATTQGPGGKEAACSTTDPSTGALCEFSDANCFQQGTRTVTINGTPATESSRANICYQGRFQNGDLDFDGNSYIPDWPNGTKNFPTSIRYVGPFTRGGNIYPKVQFETDAPASENQCVVATGVNCTAPPQGARFYPFWTLTNQQRFGVAMTGSQKPCVWNFGNKIRNVTTNTLGRDKQYGKPNLERFGGTTISSVMANPEFLANCGA
jgi:hypothetical protein